MAIVKVILSPAPRVEPAPSLFAPGMAWLRAAEEWAAGRGELIERHTVDQRFVVLGKWHSIGWDEDGQQWRVFDDYDRDDFVT